MKQVLDRLGDVLEKPNDNMHMMTTIGMVLMILSFMCASLYVLITSAA